MGIGDDILAAGEAQYIYRQTGLCVRILDERGMTREHELWELNPAIVRPQDQIDDAQCVILRRHRGCRAHILRHERTAFVFSPHYTPRWPTIALRHAEWQFGDLYSDAIVLEPNVRSVMMNKQWGWVKWQALANRLLAEGERVVQVSAPGARWLDGVEVAPCETLRQAAAIMARCRHAVLPEGCLHHLRASFRARAVVIFGGFIAPTTTGYEGHANLFSAPFACGSRRRCGHCDEAMDKISVDMVYQALKQTTNLTAQEAA